MDTYEEACQWAEKASAKAPESRRSARDCLESRLSRIVSDDTIDHDNTNTEQSRNAVNSRFDRQPASLEAVSGQSKPTWWVSYCYLDSSGQYAENEIEVQAWSRQEAIGLVTSHKFRLESGLENGPTYSQIERVAPTRTGQASTDFVRGR